MSILVLTSMFRDTLTLQTK